jgi:hypothetical protein
MGRFIEVKKALQSLNILAVLVMDKMPNMVNMNSGVPGKSVCKIPQNDAHCYSCFKTH